MLASIAICQFPHPLDPLLPLWSISERAFPNGRNRFGPDRNVSMMRGRFPTGGVFRLEVLFAAELDQDRIRGHKSLRGSFEPPTRGVDFGRSHRQPDPRLTGVRHNINEPISDNRSMRTRKCGFACGLLSNPSIASMYSTRSRESLIPPLRTRYWSPWYS